MKILVTAMTIMTTTTTTVIMLTTAKAIMMIDGLPYGKSTLRAPPIVCLYRDHVNSNVFYTA